MRTIQLAPELADRVASARREERRMGIADFRNFYRKPYGPGRALVGDATYQKDPIIGQGVSDAFCYAEKLAGAIDDGFSGRRPLDAAAGTP